jgi:hypothetical protein
VVAGREDLNGLGPGVMDGVEQAGVQALLEEDVGREAGLHHFLRYSSGGCKVLQGDVWLVGFG